MSVSHRILELKESDKAASHFIVGSSNSEENIDKILWNTQICLCIFLKPFKLH